MKEFRSSSFDIYQAVIVFLFSFGLLLFELALTRVLSVIFYYHTAFLAVSLAMLGLAGGGIWVYLFHSRLGEDIFWLLGTAVSMLFAVLLFSFLRFDTGMLDQLWTSSFFFIFLVVFFFSFLPFLAAGVVFAFWFRRYRHEAHLLYSVDLLGAALGALALVPVMEFFGGLSVLLIAAFLVSVATALASHRVQHYEQTHLALVVGTLLFLMVGAQWYAPALGIQVDMSKPHPHSTILFKKWNAVSRIVLLSPQGWYRALSSKRRQFWKGRLPRQLDALIDINAFAPILEFDGDLKKSRYLKELVSNIGYHLLPAGRKILILGPGGGKDVLGALHFKPAHITGIELNPILVEDLLRNRLKRFSGHLYEHPKVSIIVGEGRSVLSRLRGRFDIIVANSVFTWAANSSGAMNLAEHSLYTEEACELYLSKLTKRGILSISLWDLHGHVLPLRWISTCRKALKRRGIHSIDEHVAVIGNYWDHSSWFSTILISKSPWSRHQRQLLVQLVRKWDYDLLFLKGSFQSEAIFESFFHHPHRFVRDFRFDLRPATDDRPFFLYTAKVRDIFRRWKKDVWEENAALVNLLLSLIFVAFLLFLVLFLPLWLGRRFFPRLHPLNWNELLFFSAIGVGFMLVEIPLIQKLTLFLGYPTYSLTVVLAGLLFWTGLGSLLSGRWKPEGLRRTLLIVSFLLVVLLVLLPKGLMFLSQFFYTWPLWERIVIAFLFLAPLGLMGVMLPSAMKMMELRKSPNIPWAWAINGASSVFASVLAIWVAVEWGFSFAFQLAAFFYALAGFTQLVRRRS